jgi:hypothetical protein
MTPKEKAEKLVDKYFYFGDQEFDYSKEFALIAVDEILCEVTDEDDFSWWNKVKQEIELL